MLSTAVHNIPEPTLELLRKAVAAAIKADRESADKAARDTSRKLILSNYETNTVPEVDAQTRRRVELDHPTAFELKEFRVTSKNERSMCAWIALNYSLRHSHPNNNTPGFVDGDSTQIAFFHSATDRRDYEGTVTRVKVASKRFEVFTQTWPARGVDPGWRKDGKELVMKDMLVPLVARNPGGTYPVLGCLLRDPPETEMVEDGATRTFYATCVFMHPSAEPAAGVATTDDKPRWPEARYSRNLPRPVFDRAVLIMKVLSIGFGVCPENESDETANDKPGNHNTWPLGWIVQDIIDIDDETRARLGWSPVAK